MITNDTISSCENVKSIESIRPSNTHNLGDLSEQTHIEEREEFSKYLIHTRYITTENLRNRLVGCKINDLKSITTAKNQTPFSFDNMWAVFAVLSNKNCQSRTTKNGDRYAIWKVCDLQGIEISFFVFGEAYSTLLRENLSVGSLICIITPSILPGKEKDHPTSLSLRRSSQVIHIGISSNFGICKGRNRNSNPCHNVINKKSGQYCQFHIKQAFNSMKRRRTDLSNSKSGSEPWHTIGTIGNKAKPLPYVYKNTNPKFITNNNYNYKNSNLNHNISLNTTKPKPCAKNDHDKFMGQSILDSKQNNNPIYLNLNGNGINNRLSLKNKASILSTRQYNASINNKNTISRFNSNSNISINHQNNIDLSECDDEEWGTESPVKNKVEIVKKNLLEDDIKPKSTFTKELCKNILSQSNVLKKNLLEDDIKSKSTFTKEVCKNILSQSNVLKKNLLEDDIKSKSTFTKEVCKNIKPIDLNSTQNSIHIDKSKNNRKDIIQPIDPNSTQTLSSIQKLKKQVMNNNNNSHKQLIKPNNNNINVNIDIEKIQATKSQFADILDDVNKENLLKKVDLYEKQEEIVDQMKNTTCIDVGVYTCLDCGYFLEKQHDLCKQRGHTPHYSKTKKYFFECIHCKKINHSLGNSTMKRACNNCGYLRFRSASIYNQGRKGTEAKKPSDMLLIRGKEHAPSLRFDFK